MDEQTELLASYWTLATGAEPHTPHEASSVDFRERVEAAARAGFKGMGIWQADLDKSLQTYSLREMKQILDDNGIRHVELEFLTGWFSDDEATRSESNLRKRGLFTAAEALNARHIKVGDFFRTPCPMPRLVECFADLCSEAASYGTCIGFEMMPFAIVDSVEACRQLVAGAGQKNGGIILDLWHIVKLGIPYREIARLPMPHVIGIELNDGSIQSMPDLVEETTQFRKLCGEGEFDVKGFVRAMRDAGYRRPWGIEVLSKELRYSPTAEVARRAFDSTAAQFQ